MQSIVSAGLPVVATQKGGNIIDIYNKLAHTKKRRPQDITDNIIIFKSQQMQYAGRGC